MQIKFHESADADYGDMNARNSALQATTLTTDPLDVHVNLESI